jgi:hypothetical protein
MRILDIHKLSCFNDPERVKNLNRLIVTNPDLMPHQVAIATGCSIEQAMQVLMLLYDQYLANAFTLIYHKSHPEAPPALALQVDIAEGIPHFPIRCPICDEVIASSSDVTYGFLFVLKEKVRFIIQFGKG